MLDRGHGQHTGTPRPARPAGPPAPPPAASGRPLADRVQHEIDQVTDELLTALQKYRTAKRVYATRMAVFEATYGPTAEADIAAKSDYRRARAISDCTWWRGEVMVASNALTALRSLAGGGRP